MNRSPSAPLDDGACGAIPMRISRADRTPFAYFYEKPLRDLEALRYDSGLFGRGDKRQTNTLKRERALSSVGRADPLQGLGREFDPLSAHQIRVSIEVTIRKNGAVVQLVRIPACHAGGRGFEPRPLRQHLGRRVFPLRGTRIWARRDSLARESAARGTWASPVRSASFKEKGPMNRAFFLVLVVVFARPKNWSGSSVG